MAAGNTTETSPRSGVASYSSPRNYSPAELIADAIVHGIGIAVSITAGSLLLRLAVSQTEPHEFAGLVIYVISLVALWSASMAFNLWPVTPVKMHLARLDQAAIFLFIAGTYTPLLALISDTPVGNIMTMFVWSTALIGISLKLFVPHRFGRIAIPVYAGIGWSGVVVFQSLAAVLPTTSLWLLVGGGLAYTFGIVFHLWEKLRFQNALWHCFVAVGACLHLLAILYGMVISRM